MLWCMRFFLLLKYVVKYAVKKMNAKAVIPVKVTYVNTTDILTDISVYTRKKFIRSP